MVSVCQVNELNIDDEASAMRFLIADDHPLFRDALTGVVRRAFSGAMIKVCNDFSSAEEIFHDGEFFDLALLDLYMPDGDGYYGLIYLRNNFPSVPVAIVSGNEDPMIVRRCMSFGASGFIPKSLSPEQMIAALKQILAGEIWLPDTLQQETKRIDDEDKAFAQRVATLTQQQYKVLCGLHEGGLNKQIAFKLGISEATVKAHLTAIFKKLGVKNRTQAVIAAQKLDFMSHLGKPD